jgi:hypothetical protein
MLAMALSSHTGEGAAEATLVMASCRYRVMVAMALPNLADKGTAEEALVVV